MAWQNSITTSIVQCGLDSLPEQNSVQVFKPSTKAKLVFPIMPKSGKVVIKTRNMRNSMCVLSVSVCILKIKSTVNLTDDV